MLSKKVLVIGVISLVLGLTVGFVSSPTFAQGKKGTVEFGVVPWSESIALGGLIEYVLEVQVGVNVNSTNPDIGVAYTAVKNKELDLFVEAWLPTTHENYWSNVAADVLNFGPVYEDAGLTWAVPDYVYEAGVHSVTDLGDPEVKKKLDGKITGIDPGSGLMQHSELMIQEKYPELKGYELIASSDSAMVASLDRAIKRDDWIVVTLWAPHDAYALYDIKSLEEPKNVLGGEERIHMVGRKDFMTVFPNKVSEFLSRFHLTFAQEMELTGYYNELNDAYAAGEKFAKKHPKLVKFWVEGPSALS